MKPYLSEILEHNGKTHALPIPAKYRELFDCVRVLGLKDTADEDDMKLIGYRSIHIPKPDLNLSRHDVYETGVKISNLSDAQVKAIGDLCDAFQLPFSDVLSVLAYLDEHQRKENSEHENQE